MKKTAVIYKADTGKILQRIEGTQEVIDATASAMSALAFEVEDDLPYESTHQVVDGELVVKPIDLAAQLARRRVELCAQIDLSAECFRKQFLTSGEGQAMTYQRKETEARAWVVGADPDAFPFLAREAAAKGLSIADTVTAIIEAADQWSHIGSKVEAIRLGAKVVVSDAASDLATIEAAANIDWNAAIAGTP